MCFIGKEFEYRGFKTTVKFSKENTEGFYNSFVDAVEDYLEFCKEVNKTPIKL